MIIFDTLQNREVEFIPIRADEVRIYVCGPTLYDHAHLGHARSAIVFDLLRRVLEELGYRVVFVKNWTDIDDKIIRKIEESGKSLTEITEHYRKSYLQDMEALNVLPPTYEPKATENIDSMVQLVSSLLKRDIAYRTSSGDIYFDTSKDSQYLSLSKRFQDHRESRLENIEKEKRNPGDFVLWKAKRDRDIVYFDTEIGEGRPGWHIECSAMIERHLAYRDERYSIDIHGGGADLVFPHHENEASQSRCATNRELAKYWLHNGFVKIDGEKMSKSLGNSFFIKDALKHYSGEVLRFYLLSTHYRQDFNFSEEELIKSKKRLDKLYRLKKRIYGTKAGEANPEVRKKILDALTSDLNISVALSVIDEFVSDSNERLDRGEKGKGFKREVIGTIEYISKLLGVGGKDAYQYFQFGISEEEREEIENLISQRSKAKKNRDFATADRIREELQGLGIQIMDTPNGTIWEKIN